MLVDAALFLEQTENGGCFDSGLVDPGAQAVGDAAGDILIEAAAGDVADALHVCGLDAAEDGLDIDDGGTEQGLAQSFTQLVIIPAQIGVLHVEYLADQRVAVGVEAGGGQSQHHIALCHAAGIDDLGLVHHAHGEARQIVVISGHHAGVLGGLTADESAAGLDTALRHAGDDGCHLFRHVLADGDVIQEKQGLRAAADHVIHAHGHAVDADGVMLVQQFGQTQFGAHTVGAGNQHRLRHTGQIGGKQAAEAANVRNYAGDVGALDVRAHQLDALVTGSDVHTGCRIGGGVRFFHVDHSFPFQQ